MHDWLETGFEDVEYDEGHIAWLLDDAFYTASAAMDRASGRYAPGPGRQVEAGNRRDVLPWLR